MRLIYENTGEEVKVGDKVSISNGTEVIVFLFRKPHKPSSGGKVFVTLLDGSGLREYFVSVIGAIWVEREDR